MSTIAFVLVIFSAMLHAYWNLIAKKQARNPAVFFLGLGFAFLALVIPAMFAFTTFSALTAALPFMVATGVLHAMYYALLFKGYAQYDLSSLYPLARGIGIAGVAIVSIAFYHAAIPPLGLAALLCVMFGVITLRMSGRAPRSLAHIKPGVLLTPVMIGMAITCYTLVDNEGVKNVSPIVYAAGLTLFTLVFLLPLGLWRDGQLRKAWVHNKKPSLIVGLGSIGTYLIILFVYRLTQISFVVALRESSVAIGAIIGIVILKEKWNYRKALGVGLIVAGAILLRLA